MLRRAVKKCPYDWAPLLAPVLQAYRSSIFEATGFTPHRLTFGREMSLPVDFGTPLPEPVRNLHSFAIDLADQLEWAYRLSRKVIGLGHKRAQVRHNERVVQKQFVPDALVRVVRHG